jgi:GTPase Era involved in 16S rRNA processing
LKGINEEYYNKGQYEYEYLKLLNKTKNIKGENVENIYNAFLFSNNVNQEFADILFFYLKEYDVHNKRKNVIISFGYENIILNSMIRLKSVSQESIPIVIIINRNFIYDERLDYINNIPSLSTIKKNLRKENQNYDKRMLNDLSKKCLITYIKTKLFRICAYYNEMGYKLNMINPLNDINAKITLHATIALVGDSGTGKSTLLNIVFNELVSKVNISSEDVTLKCSEYYLTVQTANENDENIGQLRFLDFPGLNENKNYILVENEINSKLTEYKTNLEQIDIALFFIRNGQGRTINENHKKLIDLLSKNNIKILFIKLMLV